MTSAQPAAAEILEDLEALRAATRAQLQPTSLPLLVFGGLLLVAAALPSATFDFPWSAYWLIAAPAGFAIIAARYRRIEAEVGVGNRSRHYRLAAVGAAVIVFMIASLLIFLVSPLAGAGVALYAVARATRDGALTVAAAVLVLFGLLEPWFILSNRVYEVGQLLGDPDGSEMIFRYSRNIVTAVVGLGMVGAGLVARRHRR